MKCLMTAFMLMLLIFFTGCNSNVNTVYNGKDAEEIYIGVSYPMEKNDTTAYLKEGIELALYEVNSSGGVMGKPLKVLKFDDENDENVALKYAREFAECGITAVVGHWGSKICYMVEDIYEENKVVMLAPCATSKSIFEYDYNYIYRTCTNSQVYAEEIAEHIKSNNYDNIAICYTDDVYGFDFANSLQKELSERGINVIDRVTNLTNANSEKIHQRWQAFGCEGVVMSHTMPDAVNIIRLISGMGELYSIWGADNFQRTNFVSQIDECASDIYRIENDFSSIDSEFYENFVNSYGHEPDIFAVSGYDAVKLIAKAMNDMETIDGTKLAEYLSNVKDYSGAAGVLSYDPETKEFSGHKVQVVSVK